MILIVRTKTKEKATFYLKALLVLIIVAFLLTQAFNLLHARSVSGWMKETKASVPMRVEQRNELQVDLQEDAGDDKATSSQQAEKKAAAKKNVSESEASGGGLLQAVIKQLKDFYAGDK